MRSIFKPFHAKKVKKEKSHFKKEHVKKEKKIGPSQYFLQKFGMK